MTLMGFSDKVKSETVNIGADKEYSMNEISKITIEEFKKITGRDVKDVIHVEDRPCEVKFSWCSHEKSKKYLGYEEKTTLREGIRKIIEWAYQNFPNGVPNRYLEELEITEKAPKTWTQKLI